MRILVVEDEAELGRLIADRLHRCGFDVDVAPTLADARATLAAHSFALALLDRRMPDGDGVSLIADIKRMHPGARVLVLGLAYKRDIDDPRSTRWRTRSQGSTPAPTII